MKMNTSRRLALSMLVVGALLSGCQKNEPQGPAPAIRPTKASEEKAYGFQRAKVYKGDWRPLVDCQSTQAAGPTGSHIVFDLWERTLTMDRGGQKNSTLNHTYPDPELTGQPVGTNRVWILNGSPIEVAGSPTLKLQIDVFGKGHLFAPVSPAGCTGGLCREWTVKYECTERAVPYEQKFIDAACSGDESYVDSFMDQYTNVPDYINQVGVLGETALTCALKNQKLGVVKMLLNRPNSGLDFSAGNLKAEMPLFIDLDLNRGFAGEWLRRRDVDLNRLDNRNRTLLHAKFASVSLLKNLIGNKRFNPAILNVPDDVGTTALGSIVDRSFGTQDAITAMELSRMVAPVDIEEPAIKGTTFLETAILRKSATMARYFFMLKPTQKISRADARSLVHLAASSCDTAFVSSLRERKDLDYEMKDAYGDNAIDIVRKSACSNADDLITIFVSRGTTDRLDPVAPACRGDVGAFTASLQGGARAGAKTNPIFQCIWNRPDLLRVMLRYPNAGWDWSVIETYAVQAIKAKDSTLTSIYLNEMKWQQTTGLVQKLKAEVQSQTITATQYIDALESQRVLTNDNLKLGKYGHLMFAVIENGEIGSLNKIIQAVPASTWPTLDLSTVQGAMDFYAQKYAELAANTGCALPNALTEDTIRFAIRLGKLDEAKALANMLRRYSARPDTARVACGARTLRIMSPVNLAVGLCSAELLGTVTNLSGPLMEGTGENKMTRVSVLDAIARAKTCSPDQAAGMARQVLNTYGTAGDKELAMDGIHSNVVASLLTNAGYLLKPVITGFLNLPKAYNAVSILGDASDSVIFSRKDGSVEAGTRLMLAKADSVDGWAAYSTRIIGAITFQGLRDVAVFDSLSYDDLAKKSGCLVVTKRGALQMKESSLQIDQFTVCPNSLRFKFNPTTSEKSLPIRDYIDGEFKYSLDGVPDAN